MIKLKQKDTGDALYINPRHIVSLGLGGKLRGTFVETTTDTEEVRESQEEILALIKADQEAGSDS